jgi:hypothetical protein
MVRNIASISVGRHPADIPPLAPVKRQNIVTNVDVQIPAMTDQQGNVIPFDSTKVYQAAKAQGL